jgi:hypothetical protein
VRLGIPSVNGGRTSTGFRVFRELKHFLPQPFNYFCGSDNFNIVLFFQPVNDGSDDKTRSFKRIGVYLDIYDFSYFVKEGFFRRHFI